MHELGLCEALVDALASRGRGRAVTWARVRVGGHAVDPGVIRQGVAMAAAGTEVEGIELEVIVDPLRVRCGRCGSEEPVQVGAALAVCPRCGGVDLELVGSEQAQVEAARYAAAGEDPKEGAWMPSSC